MTQGEIKAVDAVEYLRGLAEQIFERVAPSSPPPTCWLNSDATYSYCWPCAREARWKELPTFGPAPVDKDWLTRDPIEQMIRDVIDGGYYGQGESDNVERCESCGDLLAYSLTDYGARQEVEYFLEAPVETLEPDTAYELAELIGHADWDGADHQLQADVIKIAEQVAGVLGLTVRAHLMKGE
jgi:hypothetical protein